jgi:hypothetical protein
MTHSSDYIQFGRAKYRFTNMTALIETLETMSQRATMAGSMQPDQELRSFYAGKAAAFNDVAQFLAVSKIDELNTEI